MRKWWPKNTSKHYLNTIYILLFDHLHAMNHSQTDLAWYRPPLQVSYEMCVIMRSHLLHKLIVYRLVDGQFFVCDADNCSYFTVLQYTLLDLRHISVCFYCYISEFDQFSHTFTAPCMNLTKSTIFFCLRHTACQNNQLRICCFFNSAWHCSLHLFFQPLPLNAFRVIFYFTFKLWTIKTYCFQSNMFTINCSFEVLLWLNLRTSSICCVSMFTPRQKLNTLIDQSDVTNWRL